MSTKQDRLKTNTNTLYAPICNNKSTTLSTNQYGLHYRLTISGRQGRLTKCGGQILEDGHIHTNK